MFREITGEKPAMWGPSIVGYGEHQSATGTWPRSAFSPRKGNLVVYLVPGFSEDVALLGKLGKHKTGKSCLYIKRLADVDAKVLRKLAVKSWKYMEKYD